MGHVWEVKVPYSIELDFYDEACIKMGMKGKPSRVAKRHLHEPPKEFAEAHDVHRTEKWKQQQEGWENVVEWGRTLKMPAHPAPVWPRVVGYAQGRQILYEGDFSPRGYLSLSQAKRKERYLQQKREMYSFSPYWRTRLSELQQERRKFPGRPFVSDLRRMYGMHESAVLDCWAQDLVYQFKHVKEKIDQLDNDRPSRRKRQQARTKWKLNLQHRTREQFLAAWEDVLHFHEELIMDIAHEMDLPGSFLFPEDPVMMIFWDSSDHMRNVAVVLLLEEKYSINVSGKFHVWFQEDLECLMRMTLRELLEW